jgi:hypothetical protein
MNTLENLPSPLSAGRTPEQSRREDLRELIARFGLSLTPDRIPVPVPADFIWTDSKFIDFLVARYVLGYNVVRWTVGEWGEIFPNKNGRMVSKKGWVISDESDAERVMDERFTTEITASRVVIDHFTKQGKKVSITFTPAGIVVKIGTGAGAKSVTSDNEATAIALAALTVVNVRN